MFTLMMWRQQLLQLGQFSRTCPAPYNNRLKPYPSSYDPYTKVGYKFRRVALATMGKHEEASSLPPAAEV